MFDIECKRVNLRMLGLLPIVSVRCVVSKLSAIRSLRLCTEKQSRQILLSAIYENAVVFRLFTLQ